ncbi:hypothetical protein [Sorangium sp. So ce1024]|uniref:hypothetical protein n=1 Tax=Sorangium sp. So ce1024 TaxID=3133327 RepID=UPI003F0DC44B
MSGSDIRGEARGLKAAATMAARNGRVRLRLQIPARLWTRLAQRPELKPTQHIQAAIARLLAAKPRPVLPADVALGAPEDAQQVWVGQELATRVEEAYGLESREAAILTAIARYLDEP